MYAVRRALDLILSPILFCGELEHEEPIGANQWGLTSSTDHIVGQSPLGRHMSTEVAPLEDPPLTLTPIGLDSTPPTPPYIPTEICELIIDMVGESLRGADQLERLTWLRTLRSCALVCKRWRVRSQLLLFLEDLIIFSPEGLVRVEAMLQQFPQLGACVRKLTVHCAGLGPAGCAGYPARNVSTLFPIALRGRLPSLQELHLVGDGRCHPVIVKRDAHRLPHLPLPPRFPILYKAFGGIAQLFLAELVFANFGDLARLLNCFPALDTLLCHRVCWTVLGVVPPCMLRERRTFLTGLKHLSVSKTY